MISQPLNYAPSEKGYIMKQHSAKVIWLICFLGIFVLGCSDSSTNSNGPDIYTLLATHCEPLVINVEANQTVTIATTDSVITHIDGLVEDCDFWTDANGIPDCHYVDEQPLLHDLPFMALIGYLDGEWFLVGTSFDSTFETAGQIELRVNDWGDCGEDSDNAGQFVISVSID